MDFADTKRFEIRRRLGEGGMGVVYEAWDRERQELVALKTLSRMEGRAIYLLKKEFRALADVTHPNLIALHELFSEGERWFFTMDLVAGSEFVDYVRDAPQPASTHTLTSTPPFDWYLEEAPTDHGQQPASANKAFDEAKLRRALAQLVDGVSAIHRAGKLHRDLKPSNVLVSQAGQVTILDFGVATSRLPDAAFETVRTKAVGTPAYMAPEQAIGDEPSVAADWYSVGVMLYQSLTGVLPFAGSTSQMLRAKQLAEATHPGELVTGLPEDLAQLSVRLLARELAERAGEAEVLRVLERSLPDGRRGRSPSWPPPSQPPPGSGAAAFVGRRVELALLDAAYRVRAPGRPVLVRVHGAAGMGKTALVRRFLRGLRDDAVILAGRCHECESMPFKALDSVVDALARYLRRLPLSQAMSLMPRDASALTRLFPVLTRVQAVASVPFREVESPDPQVLRRRGFAALRDLLARLAEGRPLVVFIDDLHWGDVDSAALLTELLRPPEPPGMLLLLAYRHERAAASPVLQAFSDARWEDEAVVDRREISVCSLKGGDARELAANLLAAGQLPGELARAIADESEGNPFFLGELVRYLGDRTNAASSVAGVGLTEVLQSRVSGLGKDEHALLEVIAVAGGPVLPAVATLAAQLGAAAARALRVLSAAAISRGVWLYGKPAIDVYHDHIRRAVVQTMDPERLGQCHLRLVDALERLGVDDPERLAGHLAFIGQRDRAATCAARAAATAASTLAFDRASRLYRWALSLGGTPERADWLAALGDSLAHGGRSAAAADAYLAAAAHSDSQAAHDLRRMAAEHLLRCGQTDRGLELMNEVLAAVGMSLSSSPRRALVSLAYLRTRLRARGLRVAEASLRPLQTEQRQRMDTCWSVAIGLSMVDTIHGAEFHARHLLHALDAGEPSRLARSLALEAGHVSSTGSERHDRAEALLDRAEAIGTEISDWHALGLAKTMRGLNALFAGQWRAAADLTDEAMALLIGRCSNVAWEIATARRYNLVALYYLGELKELASRVSEYLADARSRGDRFSQSCVGSGSSVIAWLIRDDPAGARALLDDELSHSSKRGFQLQQYLALQGMIYVDLYEGQGVRAHERLIERWPILQRSLLLRVQLLKRTMWALRARVALAAGQPEQLSEAQKYASRLDRDSLPVGRALALTIRAGVAHRQGAIDEAVALFRQGASQFHALGMSFKAAAAARGCALLLGGDDGARLIAHADQLMGAQGIVRPDRMTAMVMPTMGDIGPALSRRGRASS